MKRLALCEASSLLRRSGGRPGGLVNTICFFWQFVAGPDLRGPHSPQEPRLNGAVRSRPSKAREGSGASPSDVPGDSKSAQALRPQKSQALLKRKNSAGFAFGCPKKACPMGLERQCKEDERQGKSNKENEQSVVNLAMEENAMKYDSECIRRRQMFFDKLKHF